MHLKKSKKILAYFFIFLAFGSINNIKVKNLSLYKIKNIKIFGFNDYENQILIEKINELNLENIFLLNIDEFKKILNSNALIETYKIIKQYPSTLHININKTEFLAKINIEDKIFLIGSNGKLIKNESSEFELPYIFGKPEIIEFLDFKKVLDQSKFRYHQIDSLYFFQSKRWDIKLKTKVLIKLPKNNIINAINYSYEILKDKNIKNIKVIDARIANQIILND